MPRPLSVMAMRLTPPFFQPHGDRRGARIEGVFQQLLDDGRRAAPPLRRRRSARSAGRAGAGWGGVRRGGGRSWADYNVGILPGSGCTPGTGACRLSPSLERGVCKTGDRRRAPVPSSIRADRPHRNRRIAKIDMPRRDLGPRPAAVSLRFHGLLKRGAVGAHHFELAALALRHVGREFDGSDRHASPMAGRKSPSGRGRAAWSTAAACRRRRGRPR